MKIGFLIVNYNDFENTNKIVDNVKDYKCKVINSIQGDLLLY